MAKDFYKTLGVNKDASDDDIKKAYRKLAHEHHPDRAGGSEAKFKEINEAYQVLGDKQKRAQYDQFGQTFDGFQGGAQGGNPFAGFGFDFDSSQFEGMSGLGDIFETIFGGQMGGNRQHKTYHRGADLELAHQITLEEAYQGTTAHIQFKTAVACDHCKGTGHFGEAGFSTCTTCDGKGEIHESRNSFFGSFSKVRTCAKCFGTGKIPKKVCVACAGAGRMTGERSVDVQIAGGVEDGQMIKMNGMGEAGERGSGAGDLYIRIRVKQHKLFERRGSDLIMKQEMPLVDILLGKKLPITTLGGKHIEVEIPEGASLNQPIKLSGEGMPHFGSYGKGNLYIVLEIKKPKHMSAAAKKLLEELKKE